MEKSLIGFQVVTGVRQGCLLSPSLFNLFLEFIMKDLRNLDNGIQMGEMSINNIRYADDTTLMDLVFDKLQISTNELEKACSKWGMKINPTKCKIMTDDNRDIAINGSPVDKVDDFVFLGSNVPSVEADVKRRTKLAAWAFGRHKRIVYGSTRISQGHWKWGYTELSSSPLPSMGQNHGHYAKPILVNLSHLKWDASRVILGVHLMDQVKNEEIRQRLNIPNKICEEVSKRRKKWFGHVVRMPHHRLPLQAYKNVFTQQRSPGRPPTRWRDQIRGDLGVPLQEAEHQAQGRTEWRRMTCRRAKGHPVLCT